MFFHLPIFCSDICIFLEIVFSANFRWVKEKAYNLAKRRYVQEVGLLRKEIDDSDKKRLNAQQAQKRKTKMKERIQKVKKN